MKYLVNNLQEVIIIFMDAVPGAVICMEQALYQFDRTDFAAELF